MCAWCKRTPDDHGFWIALEIVMRELPILQQSELPVVTHGICEDCIRLMSALEDEPDVDGPLPGLPAG